MKKLETVFSVFLVGVLLLPSFSFGAWIGPTGSFSINSPDPELPITEGSVPQGKSANISIPQINISGDAEYINNIGVSVDPAFNSIKLGLDKGISWGVNRFLSLTSSGFFNFSGEGIKLPSKASDPSSPISGTIYYDSTAKEVKLYDGTTWKSIGSGSAEATSTNPLSIGNWDLKSTSAVGGVNVLNFSTPDADGGASKNTVLSMFGANRSGKAKVSIVAGASLCFNDGANPATDCKSAWPVIAPGTNFKYLSENGKTVQIRNTDNPGILSILPSTTGNWWGLANTNNGTKFVIGTGDTTNFNDTTDWEDKTKFGGQLTIDSSGKLSTTDRVEIDLSSKSGGSSARDGLYLRAGNDGDKNDMFAIIPTNRSKIGFWSGNENSFGGSGSNSWATLTAGTGEFYGQINSVINSPEGGALSLQNNTKTGATANNWKLYNMTGGYGNGLAFWRYFADGTNPGPTMFLADNGNVGIGTNDPKGILDVKGDGDVFFKAGSRSGSVNIGSGGGLVPLNVFGDLVVSSVPLSSPTGYFYSLIENKSSLPDPIYDDTASATFDWWKTAFPWEFLSYPTATGWDSVKISNSKTGNDCEDTSLISTQCAKNTYKAVGSAPEFVYDFSRFKEEGVANFSISYRKFKKVASEFSGGLLSVAGPGNLGGSLTVNLPNINKEVDGSGRDALILNSGGNNDSTVIKINRDKLWLYSSQLGGDANIQAGKANFSGSINVSASAAPFAGKFINSSGGLGVLSNSLKLQSNLDSSYYTAQFVYNRTVNSNPGLKELFAVCGAFLGPCPETIDVTDDPSQTYNVIPDLSTKSAGFEAQISVPAFCFFNCTGDEKVYYIYKLSGNPTKKDKVFEITNNLGARIFAVDNSGNTDIAGDVNISGNIASDLKIKSNPILNGTQTYSIVGGCHTKNGGTCENTSVFGNIIPNDGGQIKCPAGSKKIGDSPAVGGNILAGSAIFCIK